MSAKSRKSHINLHVGNIDDMGRRFATAWKSLQKGQTVAREHVTFLTFEDLLASVSPKRLQLLRYLRKAGPMSVRKLSGALGRDYKSVHQDTARLIAAGLIERKTKDQVAVTWSRAVAQLDLAA
jgi:predicted transcriptional regulator